MRLSLYEVIEVYNYACVLCYYVNSVALLQGLYTVFCANSSLAEPIMSILVEHVCLPM